MDEKASQLSRRITNREGASRRVCSRCVLPETFPGIRFNEEGICNHCQRFEANKEKLAQDKARHKKAFLHLLSQLTGGMDPDSAVHRRSAHRAYDVLMAFSGGKDSSYTLRLLKKEFNLKILAVTFNHGFVSETALENIRSVTTALEVDHLMISPSETFLCQAFRQSIDSDVYSLKTLERASPICNTCMHMAKAVFVKYALLMGIPMIAYGWSPGQAPMRSSVLKWNLSMIRQTASMFTKTFGKMLDEDCSSLVVDENDLEWLARRNEGRGVLLYNVHPLAFLEYDEQSILESIRGLGWKDPKDTDANSTNCLLNSFANVVHEAKYGFHPYACEIAGLVREGCMTREHGLAKLRATPDEEVIAAVKARLGLI